MLDQVPRHEEALNAVCGKISAQIFIYC